MSALFYFFFVLYTCIFCFGQYVMMGAGGRRKTRQAIEYVYVALKMLVAVAISPVLLLCFFVKPEVFLPVFTFLWPHLDILGEDRSLYLRRWFMTPKTPWFRPRFLHYIARSDEGRDSHNHPGRFITRILHGGYCEYIYFPGARFDLPYRPSCCGTWGVWRTADGRSISDRTRPHLVRVARPGDVLDNPEGHTHMVKLFGPTWTWVIGWIRGKPWGFWTLHPTDASQDRWTESEEYGAKGVEIKSWEIKQ